jgi:hypothetical protein
MKNTYFLLALAVLLCLGGAGTAAAANIPISGTVSFNSFPIGEFGFWDITYTAGSSAAYLSSVSIDLSGTTSQYGGSLYFDVSGAAPGLLTNLPFTPLGGPVAASVTGDTDGSTLLTLTWADGAFITGNAYDFGIDTDGNTNCGGGILGFLCNLGRTLPASFTSGAEIAGTLITLNFNAPGYSPLELTTTLIQTGALTAAGNFAGELVPEPATFALMGAGLALAALLRRRKRS